MSLDSGFQYFEFDTVCFVPVCIVSFWLLLAADVTRIVTIAVRCRCRLGSPNTIHLTVPLHFSYVWKSSSQVWLLKAVDWPLDNFDVFNKYGKEKQVNVVILTRHCRLFCSFLAPRYLLTLHKKQNEELRGQYSSKNLPLGLFRMRGFYVTVATHSR